MSETLIRQELVNMLTVRQAHMQFEDAVKDFPAAHYNTRPPGLDYSFWHLLEHIRICQWDILDYCRNPGYKMPEWPREYWPAPTAQTDAAGWQGTIRAFLADRDALVKIIQDAQTDLYRPIAHGWNGHTIFREIMVVASHNAYHIGEFAILRGALGLWG
ncbi:MAG: DinB family protein [Chloroflexi bacterium]|nr:DinB family protein [Chloroflexota bacterium]